MSVSCQTIGQYYLLYTINLYAGLVAKNPFFTADFKFPLYRQLLITQSQWFAPKLLISQSKSSTCLTASPQNFHYCPTCTIF